MIEFIKISSFTIFDEAVIEFGDGLNAITGETGAGKSLIIAALTLLKGARANGSLVRPGADKAVIEALFTQGEKDYVLRREILASGRSRCFINGGLSTTASLETFTSPIINIYGQHGYQDLLNPREHMRIIEEMANLGDRGKIAALYSGCCDTSKSLNDLKLSIEESAKEQAVLAESAAELRAAQIVPGMEEKIELELEMMHASSELSRAANESIELLYSGSPSVTDIASEVRSRLNVISSLDREMAFLVGDLDGITAQVEDLSQSIRGRLDHYEFDQQSIDDLESKLFSIRALKKKYSTDEKGLLSVLAGIEERISLAEDSSFHLSRARAALDRAFSDYETALLEFVTSRMSFCDDLCARINLELAEMGMPEARLSVRQVMPEHIKELFSGKNISELSPTRLLDGEFLITTNAGQNMQPLARIASGGELSRIMLAIKLQHSTGSCLVFDEIDSGISGQTSIMIAEKLKNISRSSQTIVITHLHQVASVADTHLVVVKTTRDNTTFSGVSKLAGDDRIMELARMMGGADPSSKVIAHAKELLDNTRKTTSFV